MSSLQRISLSLLAVVLLCSCGGKPPEGTHQVKAGDAAPVTPDVTETNSPAPSGKQVRYELNENTEMKWTGYKVVGQHSGSFMLYEGTVDMAEGDLASTRFDVLIETMSVETDNNTLTKIVKEDQFFDVMNYPEMTFVSTGVEKGETNYWVSGNLMIRDVTKSIRFPAAMAVEGDLFTMSSTFTLNRRDWNIIYDGVGDSVLKDDVLIEISAEAELATPES